MTTQLASADPLDVVEFDSPGGVTLSDNAFFSVYESSGGTICDESGSPISVSITSTKPGGEIRDSFSLDAIEIDDPTPGARNPADETCIFGNTFLHFMTTDQRFSVGDTMIVFQNEISGGEDLDEEITTVDVTVTSSSDTDGIMLTLTEDGENTGHFENTLLFTGDDSVENSALHVEPGDIITVDYLDNLFYGQVLPSPNGSAGVLVADVGDTITATYNGISGTTEITVGSGPGGSGGGLVINPVVLDVLAGGASGGDFAPPLLTISKLNLSNLPLIGDMLDFILNADPFTPIMPLDDPSIDYPVSINGNGFLLTQYANTIQTYTGKTGEHVSFKMTLFDATGVEHIALYTNLRGDAREIQDSDTFIIYNEDKPLEITDPHGFFSNVNFTESEYNGKYIASFDMTFAKPMDTSDVIVRTWDELRNSGDLKVLYAIKIDGEPIINSNTNNLVVPDSAEIVIPYYKLPYYEIPEADFDGNLVYYNSFGGLEEKQVQPYRTPIVYPDYIGRAERHDDGFYESIVVEKMKSQIIINELIGTPFISLEEKHANEMFFYPDNVGRLDRKDVNTLKDTMNEENVKATIISAKRFVTNHLVD